MTFREPQRVRYTSADGKVVHDEVIEVRYEFTSIDASMRFQGDLRRQDLVDYFDMDVVFSDTHGRTDSLTGAVRGLATIQRIKLWRDRFSGYHCLTFYSNRPSSRRDRRYREYLVTDFQEELRNRDDKHRECRLGAIGRRGSAPNAVRARSFSISSPSSWGRSRQKSTEGGLDAAQASTGVLPLDIRWLGLRFSREAGELHAPQQIPSTPGPPPALFQLFQSPMMPEVTMRSIYGVLNAYQTIVVSCRGGSHATTRTGNSAECPSHSTTSSSPRRRYRPARPWSSRRPRRPAAAGASLCSWNPSARRCDEKGKPRDWQT